MKTILLVDDDRLFRECIKEALEIHDLLVTEAENGSEALEILKTQKFDLIITDIAMPVMTGVEFGVKIRELGLTTPIVTMTSSPDMAKQKFGYNIHSVQMASKLTKPFSIASLMEQVSMLLKIEPQP